MGGYQSLTYILLQSYGFILWMCVNCYNLGGPAHHIIQNTHSFDNPLSEKLNQNSLKSSFPTVNIHTHPDLINGLRFRQLGNSELIVSEIGLGTEHMGDETLIDNEDAQTQLEIAHKEYGINLLDIAEYDPVPTHPKTWGRGHTEILNKFLKSNRPNLILSCRLCSSNLGRDKKHNLFGWLRKSQSSPKLTKDEIIEAVDRLLSRLGTDYIDILQIDRPDRYIPKHELGEDTYCWGNEYTHMSIQEQLEILGELITKGKIRYIGVSNETPWGLFQWQKYSKEMSLPNIVSAQSMYNILNRNEIESSGLPEMLDSRNLNIPLISYGSLAGGILTGKYLDPERFNVRGPDQRLGQDEWDNYLPTYAYNIPEDWGYLSYGPLTGKCNKFPFFYHTHRSVWSQWKLAQLLKIARKFGMTLGQLSLAWSFTRPFMGSTLIGPRTIGQLKETIRTLNFPITEEIEEDIHELFLRYRAPTMGGPQLLSSLDGPPKPQHEYLKDGRGPIWSGGTYWPNFPQPILTKKLDYRSKLHNMYELATMAGAFDDPTDQNWRDFRIWKERTEENRYGEYFAVKESKLFGWDQKKFYNWNWVNLTEHEKSETNTMDFHFVWKDNKVFREPTTQAMIDFYNDELAVLKILKERYKQVSDRIKYKEQLGDQPDVFHSIDFDLIDLELRRKHNIDILDPKVLDIVRGDLGNLTEFEQKTIPFWYWEEDHPDNPHAVRNKGSFL